MKTEINHTGIWYDLLGSRGPKVALLHGWGCSHQLMMPLAEAMKDHYRLLDEFGKIPAERLGYMWRGANDTVIWAVEFAGRRYYLVLQPAL